MSPLSYAPLSSALLQQEPIPVDVTDTYLLRNRTRYCPYESTSYEPVLSATFSKSHARRAARGLSKGKGETQNDAQR